MKKISKNKICQSRQLRKQMTKAEIKLWQAIRCKRLSGYRFRRQAPMGIYIVDFICHEAKVIIELDGGQHNEDHAIEYDRFRTEWLNREGYTVLRFWNMDVFQSMENVLNLILDLCRRSSSPHPILPPQGGKEPTNLLV